jgi:hypothetical protein
MNQIQTLNLGICKDSSTYFCTDISSDNTKCINDVDKSCKARDTSSECYITNTRICKFPLAKNEYIDTITG